MRTHLQHIVIIILMAVSTCLGQLSPGDLSQAHADLEGMSKCTLCHDLGKKVNNNKCLECHKDIQSLIKQNKGYHVSTDVAGKDCYACHSEHHGRKFDMVRFDEQNFNHNLTKYKLEGAHASLECKECHKPVNIQNVEIKKRPGTFLGLKQDCLSCHNDYHQNTLSVSCNNCHDMKSFKPASRFDHNKADFKLTGKHAVLECKECHKVSTKNGKEFQQFNGIPHNDCVACHNDPHNNRITGKCTQCHNENSFTEFTGTSRFDHSTTDFQLKGKHKSVQCFNCHVDSNDPKTIFHDKVNVTANQCVECHKDIHQGKFGNNCAACHTETGFLSLKSMTTFDHSATDFPLVGKHAGVDCKSCHKLKYTEPINFSACKNCHSDYHRGEFAKNGVSPDCSECHSLSEGFSQTTYSLEKHQKTDFPLKGAHTATPCFSCHVSEDKWTFREYTSTCTQCHKDVHGKRFEINGITDCERCHDSESWFPSRFDHNLTAFPLDGRHANVDCRLCHKSTIQGSKTLLDYKIPNHQCIDCHH